MASVGRRGWKEGDGARPIRSQCIVRTGLLREEAGGLWTSVAAERKRFRQNVVWQSYSARRELCHGAIKKIHVLKPPKVVVAVHFAM